MQRQSTTVDVNDVKINVSSQYGSPSLSRRSTSSNNESKELEFNSKTETSLNVVVPEAVNIIEKPVTIPIQEINNDDDDDQTIDVTKSVNDMVTIKNECNSSATRQSSVKKKDTHICDVLWHSVSLVAWPAININTLIQQVVGVGQMRQMVTTETQTDIIDCDVVYKKPLESAEIIL